MMQDIHVSLVNVEDILMRLLNTNVRAVKHSSQLPMEAIRTTLVNVSGPLRCLGVAQLVEAGILVKVGPLLKTMKLRMLKLRTLKVKT